jgi:predicted transcriptional regulator
MRYPSKIIILKGSMIQHKNKLWGTLVLSKPTFSLDLRVSATASCTGIVLRRKGSLQRLHDSKQAEDWASARLLGDVADVCQICGSGSVLELPI